MAKWTKRTLKLKKDHAWKAKPGYRVFVADRGAVQFNFPEEWHIEPGDDAMNFYDRQPPDDNCRLACSYIRLPPIDWSGLPLSQLIETAVADDPRGVAPAGDVVQERRRGLEVAWQEFSFVDPNENRPAYTRLCIGRSSHIQALITLDYWPEDAEWVRAVWAEVIRSLELGRYISDVTTGKAAY